MNDNNIQCTACGRSWAINSQPQHCTCGAYFSEYDYTLPACIRNKDPECKAKAVIANKTVEKVSNMEGLCDAFVHVLENNTTYYLDSNGYPMITWAGPLDMARYDIDNNPNKLKKQLLHTTRSTTSPVTGETEDDDVVVYYDGQGQPHILMTEDDITRMFEYIQNEETQIWTAVDGKQDKLTAGANITIRKDDNTGETIISATGGGGDSYGVTITPGAQPNITWVAGVSFQELKDNLDKITVYMPATGGFPAVGYKPAFATIESHQSLGEVIHMGLNRAEMTTQYESTQTELRVSELLLANNGTGMMAGMSDRLQSRLTAGQNITISNSNVISAIVDLTNYYNKAEVNQLISDLDSISMRVVDTLPATGVSNIIYLVQRQGENVYDQWVYSDNQWFNIGDTEIDLSAYYTKAQADAKFQEILSDGASIAPVTDATELSSVDLGGKVVNSVTAEDIWDYMWEKIYPVGSIYTTITNDDPATLFGGTWEIVGANRVLWGVGSGDTAGTTLSEQLPNIKGTWRKNSSAAAGNQVTDIGSGNFTGSGAITKTTSSQYNAVNDGNPSTYVDGFTFDAHNSSSVYTDNGIVRPNAYTVKFWRRTA